MTEGLKVYFKGSSVKGTWERLVELISNSLSSLLLVASCYFRTVSSESSDKGV